MRSGRGREKDDDDDDDDDDGGAGAGKKGMGSGRGVTPLSEVLIDRELKLHGLRGPPRTEL
jgi:hypothetical protein